MVDRLRTIMDEFLIMLDGELTRLEATRKMGSYWKRLRQRKRLVQTVLELAQSNRPLPEVWAELRNEFFKGGGAR